MPLSLAKYEPKFYYYLTVIASLIKFGNVLVFISYGAYILISIRSKYAVRDVLEGICIYDMATETTDANLLFTIPITIVLRAI